MFRSSLRCLSVRAFAAHAFSFSCASLFPVQSVPIAPVAFSSRRWLSSGQAAGNDEDDQQQQQQPTRDELLREHQKLYEQPADLGDYFRVETLEDATPPDSVIEWRVARGSGPGGQAVNSGSNKAELRVNLQSWRNMDPLVMCDETHAKLLEQNGKSTAQNGTLLIVTSHKHRSLDKNKEECIAVVRQMVRQASYVPPAAAPRMKFDPNVMRQVVHKKHARRNFNKTKATVRSGKW
jgi:ribosome-associated protein